jgi:hypothetical protein
LIVGEELETKHRVIGLGSISNEERRFTIVGTISSMVQVEEDVVDLNE